MAKFSIPVVNKYGIGTFEDVKNTYAWIVLSLKKLNIDISGAEPTFLFSTGKIQCSAIGIEEFIQHAYGMADFHFINFDMLITSNDRPNIYIFMNYGNEINISASDKRIIQDIANTLNETALNENTVSSATNITINGDNNAIASNKSTAIVMNDSEKIKIKNYNNIETTSEKSRLKKILNSIFTNIVSNLVWYILCFLIGALGTYLLSKFF